MTLTAEYVRDVLDYDPDTGVFTWAKPVAQRTKVGDVAGCLNKQGYIRILNHQAHRLAWLYVHGEWPEGDIDHINRVKNDNRICNLRVVSNAQNLQNRLRPTRRNTSGYRGVSKQPSGNWQASIRVDGKKRYIGTYPSKEEAYAAYLEAKTALHPYFAIDPEVLDPLE